jgi:isopentenyl-diphosphate delta-isomerase
MHDALSEQAVAEIDTSVEFLGARVRFPVFISCMTGGSEEGFRANRELARAAGSAGVPVGMGSIRILFDHPELFQHFHLKPLAPAVPVLANLGVVQVRDRDHRELVELVRRLEADCLVVHVNPGQELFQPDGDRDFRGTMEPLARLCAAAPFPVIVKETGFGIGPALVRELVAMGVSYVDIAGAGGTNWVSVESFRLEPEAAAEAEEFRSWGLPTGLVLAALRGSPALLEGLALPLARAVRQGGADAVLSVLESLERTLRRAMLLTGARDLASLRRGKVWLDPWLVEAANSLLAAGDQPSG